MNNQKKLKELLETKRNELLEEIKKSKFLIDENHKEVVEKLKNEINDLTDLSKSQIEIEKLSQDLKERQVAFWLKISSVIISFLTLLTKIIGLW
ncbi:MAG: hypothetical protein ABF289_20820 [Clostridiales bacterium]